MLPPAPLRRRRPLRRSPSPHSRDHEPDEPGVDEDVADAHGLTDRLRHGDHVRQERQVVLVREQVMLVRAGRLQGLEHVPLTGVDQRLRARRHASVHRDDREVARETDQNEHHPRHADVRRRERDEEGVRQREHARPNHEVAARRPLREGDELDPEPDDHQSPPPRAKRLESAQAAAEQVAEIDGEQDDGEQQLHRRAMKRPTRCGRCPGTG